VTPPPTIIPAVAKSGSGVVVDARKRVQVPSFEGSTLRTAVEKADSLGLRIQAAGSGIAREQAPASGTSVPVGTEVVLRFAR